MFIGTGSQRHLFVLEIGKKSFVLYLLGGDINVDEAFQKPFVPLTTFNAKNVVLRQN